MIEMEKTFLAKYLPEGLEDCKSKEIVDIYIPKEERHPVLRLRSKGGKYFLTKKEPLDKSDASTQEEQGINLSKEEFDVLSKLDGKTLRKKRFFYPYKDRIAEFDVFKGDLKGLVLVDFEFEDETEKRNFNTPPFCLEDITDKEFIAGGMLCGKKLSDIIGKLKEFNYRELSF